MSDSKVYDVLPHAAERALIDEATYQAMYKRSIEDPEGFWADMANEHVHWFRKWDTVADWTFDGDVGIRWFDGAKVNVAYNCLDRHLEERGDRPAILWEGDQPGEERSISFRALHAEVCRFANVLKSKGVRKGDRVCVYMPMVPEAAVAMLACARIGAVHSVVFGGFSPDALRDRILDSDCRVVVTADEGPRGGRNVPLKKNTHEALEACPSTHTCIVVRRTGNEVPWRDGRDVWYHEVMADASADCPAEELDAEDPLFILYTSGSTGMPKGVQHSQAGYLLYTTLTFKYIFDYHEGDVFWCTADVGWVTGHSYVVYSPLSNGATTVMFEGVPNYPDFSRFWQICDKFGVNIFYTAPTAIRALMGQGDDFVKRTSRESVRILGTVGEPINPEAWEWYYHVVGEARCPIVDTWWQTETGGVMITPLPGCTALKPGSATRPLFGIEPVLVDNEGNELDGEAEGALCIKRSWPGTDANRVRRSRTLHPDLLRDVQGPVHDRGRCAPRRGRGLLDHRAGGRRHQRVGAPDGHRGGRERAGAARDGGGGGGGRLPAPHQGPGNLRLRDPERRHRGHRRAEEGARGAGAQGDWADRLARCHPVRAGAAEDSVGQDHAAHPAQGGGERDRQSRRHLDTCRAGGGRRHHREPAESVGRLCIGATRHGPNKGCRPFCPGSAGVYLPAADNKSVNRPQWAEGPPLLMRTTLVGPRYFNCRDGER